VEGKEQLFSLLKRDKVQILPFCDTDKCYTEPTLYGVKRLTVIALISLDICEEGCLFVDFIQKSDNQT
jgi:hypothetical protein